MTARDVVGDADQPRAECRSLAEAVEPSPRSFEGLLSQIVGIVAVPEHRSEATHDVRVVVLVEGAPGQGIAPPGTLHESLVVSRRHLERGNVGRPRSVPEKLSGFEIGKGAGLRRH